MTYEEKFQENINELRRLALKGDDLALDVLLTIAKAEEGQRIYMEFEQRIQEANGVRA